MTLRLVKSDEPPKQPLELSDKLLVPDGWEMPGWMRELAIDGDDNARDIVRMWDSGDAKGRRVAYFRAMKNTEGADSPADAKARFILAKRKGLGRLLRDALSRTNPTLQ